MPARPPRRPRPKPATVRGRRGTSGKGVASRALTRRLARLAATVARERERSERRLAALRRDADRRLAAMMAEIAALRHHEARADALARLVTERDRALAEQTRRIGELEALLRTPTDLR